MPQEEVHTAIDLETETLLSLTEASRALPRIDGKRPHPSTLWRWCRKGVRGVRLEYVRLGKRICTSEKARGRVCQGLAEADVAPESPGPRLYKPRASKRTAEQRVADVAAADRRLMAAGI